MRSAMPMMFTPSQLRAARALLDWTRADCSKVTGISPETVKNIEHGTFEPTQATIDKIMNAFSNHGVEFFTLQSSATHYGVTMKAKIKDAEAEEQKVIEQNN
jgi:predicted transcriptional regulator